MGPELGARMLSISKPPNNTFPTNSLICFFDLFATLVFAIVGSKAASSCCDNIFVISFFGTITALGGGTIRDLLLRQPIFWLEDYRYLVVVGIGIVLFLCQKGNFGN